MPSAISGKNPRAKRSHRPAREQWPRSRRSDILRIRLEATVSRYKLAVVIVYLSLFVGLSSIFTPIVHAQSPFYQGKSVRIIRGGQAGDLYDGWARLIASHWGKHIAGNPNIVVQNMPGAGSVIAANYVYGVAKPDGLTVGSLNPAIYMDQLIVRKEVQFDWSKFNWIGTPEQTDFVFFMRGESPSKSIEDIRKAAKPPK